jgi:ATP-dependent DNA helicase PIF1
MKYWWVILIVIFLWNLVSSRKTRKPVARQAASGSRQLESFPSPRITKPGSRRRIAASFVPGIPKDFQLTPEFSNAFDLMENSKQHLFITGNAGTGKSTLLHYFKEKSKKKLVVVAPTGIAAINVGGSTIHSFFQFPLHVVTPQDVKVIHNKRELFNSLQTVVVDEVSMVRADIMDAIDRSLRINRNRVSVPFGGVQMILIGDLHQLPPVVESELKDYFDDRFQSPFFFSANVFKQVSLTSIELQCIFRQTDTEFIALLDKVRRNQITQVDLQSLNKLYSPTPSFHEDELAITLTSTNRRASEINQTRLDSLPSRDYYFDAIVTGDFDEKSFPTERRLRLRQGAQIMMVKNDPNKQWVNGSLGVIQKLSQDSIKVSFGGYSCSVEPMTWEKIDYEYNHDNGKIEPNVIGTFRQYPIKLAWAITVHKSQGKTFDKVIVDLGNGAFAHGQAYVALSRCTSFQGIRLRTPIKLSDIILDHRVSDFHSQGNATFNKVSSETSLRRTKSRKSIRSL